MWNREGTKMQWFTPAVGSGHSAGSYSQGRSDLCSSNMGDKGRGHRRCTMPHRATTAASPSGLGSAPRLQAQGPRLTPNPTIGPAGHPQGDRRGVLSSATCLQEEPFSKWLKTLHENGSKTLYVYRARAPPR